MQSGIIIPHILFIGMKELNLLLSKRKVIEYYTIFLYICSYLILFA